MKMNILQIEIVNSNLFILEESMRYLYFTSEYCIPCRAIKPRILKHHEIAIVDIDKSNEYVVKYNIMSIPTLLVIGNDNSVEAEISGTRISKWLDETFKE